MSLSCSDNPLENIDGAALRAQSEWLLLYSCTGGYKKLNQQGKDAINGLLNLLDEIRSYCHDKNGVDCLLLDAFDDAEVLIEPCKICGNPRCNG